MGQQPHSLQDRRVIDSVAIMEKSYSPGVRILGVQVANGFSSEARVFATLLQHTDATQVARHVLFNAWEGNTSSLEQFRALSGATMHPLDFGWRSMSPGRPFAARMKGRIRFVLAMQQALQIARQIDPDVIYSCQQLWDCQAATYLAQRLGKPQVIHLHFTIGAYLHRPVLRRLRACDHILTVSDYIRDMALRDGISPSKVTTILNSIEVKPLPPPTVRQEVLDEFRLPADTLLLGIFGRIDPYKGQADTLQAFARMLHAHPTARLLVAGGDTSWHPGYTEKIKVLAAHLHITDKVLFLGMRSDIPRLLGALDIFVHPSRMDPCPLAILEAAAASVPIVAYAEGGVQEVIQNGHGGLLVPPEDVDGLATAMQCLLDDPALRLKMGMQSQARMAAEFRPEMAGAAFTRFLNRYAPVTRPALLA